MLFNTKANTDLFIPDIKNRIICLPKGSTRSFHRDRAARHNSVSVYGGLPWHFSRRRGPPWQPRIRAQCGLDKCQEYKKHIQDGNQKHALNASKNKNEGKQSPPSHVCCRNRCNIQLSIHGGDKGAPPMGGQAN